MLNLLQVKCLKNLIIYSFTLSFDNIIYLYSFLMKTLIDIANQRHILAVDLDKINFDNDNNFDEHDPDTIIHARLLAWHCTSIVQI